MFVRLLSAETKPAYREIDIENPDIDLALAVISRMDGESVDNVVIICRDSSEFHIGGGKDGKILVSCQTRDGCLNMLSGEDSEVEEIMAGGQAILIERKYLVEKKKLFDFFEEFQKKGAAALSSGQWQG
ncbi:hypothetical protein KXS07_13790 [Inquilinus limosus]|uniref:hypothetical protein n=1 Tax=Inquilinus limosus TaxID=171674 RepID=UPI003F15746B